MVLRVLKLSIAKYLLVSSLAGIIDFIIAYVFYRLIQLSYLAACNIGILSGFIFQYFICKQFIFKQNNFFNFLIIYVITFLFGFLLADITMWISYNKLLFGFLISKALSMIVPFFLTYLIRKGLLGLKMNKGK